MSAPATFDAFALIGLAMERIGAHDLSRDCDTSEISETLAEAFGYLSKAREQLRVQSQEPQEPRYTAEEVRTILGGIAWSWDLLNFAHALGWMPREPYTREKFKKFQDAGTILANFDGDTLGTLMTKYVELRERRKAQEAEATR